MGTSPVEKWRRIKTISADRRTRNAILRMSVYRYNYPGFAWVRRLVCLPSQDTAQVTLSLRAAPDARVVKLTLRPGDLGDRSSLFENWVESSPPLSQCAHSLQLAADAGAHIGSFSLLLHSNHPQCRIVAIEPDRANAAILQENFRQNNIDGRVENVALWREDTDSLFMLEGESNAGMAVESSATAKDSGYAVKGRKLSSIMAQECRPLDFLKMDIEGAEYEVLPDVLPQFPSHACIWMELHHVTAHPSWIQEQLEASSRTGELAEDNPPHQQWLLHPKM